MELVLDFGKKTFWKCLHCGNDKNIITFPLFVKLYCCRCGQPDCTNRFLHLIFMTKKPSKTYLEFLSEAKTVRHYIGQNKDKGVSLKDIRNSLTLKRSARNIINWLLEKNYITKQTQEITKSDEECRYVVVPMEAMS